MKNPEIPEITTEEIRKRAYGNYLNRLSSAEKLISISAEQDWDQAERELVKHREQALPQAKHENPGHGRALRRNNSTTWLPIQRNSDLAKAEKLSLVFLVAAFCSFIAVLLYILAILRTDTRRFYINNNDSQNLEIEDASFYIHKEGEYEIHPIDWFLRYERGTKPNRKERYRSDSIDITFNYKVTKQEEQSFVKVLVSDSLELLRAEGYSGAGRQQLKVTRSHSGWTFGDYVSIYSFQVKPEGSNYKVELSFEGDIISSPTREVDLEFFLGSYPKNTPIKLLIQRLNKTDITYSDPPPSREGYDFIEYESIAESLSPFVTSVLPPEYLSENFSPEGIRIKVEDKELGRTIEIQLFFLGSFLGLLASFIAGIIWDIMKVLDHEKLARMPEEIYARLTRMPQIYKEFLERIEFLLRKNKKLMLERIKPLLKNPKLMELYFLLDRNYLLSFWWKWHLKIREERRSEIEMLDLWSISLVYYCMDSSVQRRISRKAKIMSRRLRKQEIVRERA